MRYFLFMMVAAAHCSWAQTPGQTIARNSIFNGLPEGDSITVYQCHVESAVQSVSTASGQTFTSEARSMTISEKYVLLRTPEGFSVRYYTTALNVFPNKKFSGLKISERPYWQFQFQKTGRLDDEDLRVFLALEKKGREAIEFDYGITRYNTNQVIFKRGRDFKQLVIESDHVISRLISY